MNKFLISALALSVTVAATAKGLDLQSRILLKRNAVEKARIELAKDVDNVNNPIGYIPKIRPLNDNGYVMGFVKIEDGHSSDDIEAAGFNVLAVRGSVAIVSLPADSAYIFADRPGVAKLTLQRQMKTHMEKERIVSGIDNIHQGIGLDVPYTGKNVMACIVDQGVDPNHIAFLDENGKSRVSYLTYYDGTMGKDGTPNFDLFGDEIYMENPDGSIYWYPTVDKFKTDELSAYHGTHTLNILGGGYKGNVEVMQAEENGSNKAVLTSRQNPYYGAAPETMLAVSCGVLADACIAFGLNGLLDYADYAKNNFGIPTVVSLSLGSTAGPHDPNSPMNLFLDECGDDAIVVLSAGNEGDLKIAASKTFTENDTSLKTFIYPYAYRFDKSKPGSQSNTYVRVGHVMIYSDDETPFTITGYLYEFRNGSWRMKAEYSMSSEEGNYYLSNDYYYPYVGGTVNKNIQAYFDGYIGGGSMIDEALNRHYGVFDYYLYTNPDTGIQDDGSEMIIVGFEIKGKPGQRIECYCDGDNTWMSNYAINGWDDGSTDGTISDLAVGKKVLTVGSYNTNLDWYNLDGSYNWYNEIQGFYPDDITFFSSYGTLADGRSLPHVCAPGSAVISAMSTPYVENFFKGNEEYIPANMQARTTVNNTTYYWKQESGTSMSTPLVAGSIALWLEADPTLTIDDVKDIIGKTARRDEFVENGNQVRWGAGKFDALAGLKEVIRRASVGDITVDGHNNRLILTPVGPNTFNVFVGDCSSLKITLTNMSGSVVYNSSFDTNSADVDFSHLSQGIYVLTANGHSSKIAIN